MNNQTPGQIDRPKYHVKPDLIIKLPDPNVKKPLGEPVLLAVEDHNGEPVTCLTVIPHGPMKSD